MKILLLVCLIFISNSAYAYDSQGRSSYTTESFDSYEPSAKNLLNSPIYNWHPGNIFHPSDTHNNVVGWREIYNCKGKASVNRFGGFLDCSNTIEVKDFNCSKGNKHIEGKYLICKED